MHIVLANSLSVAGAWVLAFMAVFAMILLPFYPLILRRRRRIAQEKAHEKVEEADCGRAFDTVTCCWPGSCSAQNGLQTSSAYATATAGQVAAHSGNR